MVCVLHMSMNFLHGSTIRLFAALLFLIPAAASAQTVTAPSGTVAVQTSGDFFSSAFQDSADMNHRTDIGWFAYGVDQPRANLSGISFANGVFSATASSNDPNIYLLETGNPVSVPLGRRGDVQSIDANRYRTLAVRMRLSGTQGARASDGQLIWSTRTIYDSPMSTAGSFAVYGGWQVYLLDIRRSASPRGIRGRARSVAPPRSDRGRGSDRSRSTGRGSSRTTRRACARSRGAAAARWTSISTPIHLKPTARSA